YCVNSGLAVSVLLRVCELPDLSNKRVPLVVRRSCSESAVLPAWRSDVHEEISDITEGDLSGGYSTQPLVCKYDQPEQVRPLALSMVCLKCFSNGLQDFLVIKRAEPTNQVGNAPDL